MPTAFSVSDSDAEHKSEYRTIGNYCAFTMAWSLAAETICALKADCCNAFAAEHCFAQETRPACHTMMPLSQLSASSLPWLRVGGRHCSHSHRMHSAHCIGPSFQYPGPLSPAQLVHSFNTLQDTKPAGKHAMRGLGSHTIHLSEACWLLR